jgi:hypothetical protein
MEHLVIRVSLALAFLCCSAIGAADTIQPLNIKPGLWETTTTWKTSGQFPLPPEAQEAQEGMAQVREALAKMPPAERAKYAKYEEMMKANSSTIEKMMKASAGQPQKPLAGCGKSQSRVLAART